MFPESGRAGQHIFEIALENCSNKTFARLQLVAVVEVGRFSIAAIRARP